MSTKSTFILTGQNEHIYYDCSDDTINLEFEKQHIDFEVLSDELRIEIKPGSELYDKLNAIFWQAGWCGSNPAYKEKK